jgi:hypothetical protein
MDAKTVSISFCGGCNPRINRGAVAREIRYGLNPNQFNVVYNTFAADVFVWLSGYRANCAQKQAASGSVGVAVAASYVDNISIDEKQIASMVLSKLKQIYRWGVYHSADAGFK